MLLSLKKTIKCEPLVANWYAWPLNISPHSFALYLKKNLIGIMESYVKSPQLHEMAVKNPSLRGGAFMDFGGKNKKDKVQSLLEQTLKNCEPYLKFATALYALEDFLNEHAKGESLEDLYSKLDDELNGFVELAYDTQHKPHFRLIEPLLYDSVLNTQALQSVIFSEIYDDNRAFVLSTPRFPNANECQLKIPFKSPLYDEIFLSRKNGITKEKVLEIAQHGELNTQETESFLNFFELFKNNNGIAHNFKNEQMRVRYFGHACVCIETNQTTILIDPFISYPYHTDGSRFSYDDLPEHIDAVLFTHAHQDHVLLETLLQIRHKVQRFIVPKNYPGFVTDPSLKLVLTSCGFNNVIELGELETVCIGDLNVTGIPFFGEHGDLLIHTKLGYHIKSNYKSCLFIADANSFSPALYKRVKKLIGSVDDLFIGMECAGAPMSWLYGPYFKNQIPRAFDQTRRLNGSDCEKAIQVMNIFESKNIYIYAMGLEPWIGFLSSISDDPQSKPMVESNKLLSYCNERNIFAKRLFLKQEIF